MQYVQSWLFSRAVRVKSRNSFTSMIIAALNGTCTDSRIATDINAKFASGTHGGMWDMDISRARRKLNPSRLRDQMFAYTVTYQIVNTFVEVGLPYITRFVSSVRNGKGALKQGSSGGEPKKRVVFEDEKEKGGMEERVFLDKVREEVTLPEYDSFADYSEMAVQFGYVALWSTIWPLAGGTSSGFLFSKAKVSDCVAQFLVMALINNIFELKSDAFKMTVHYRRPVPTRTDTIGPWLDALTFLTWLGALTNSALVYLFSPELLKSSPLPSTVNVLAKEHLVDASSGNSSSTWGLDGSSEATYNATKELVLKAVLVALAASHGYLMLRGVVRHLVERIWWKGSKEVQERESEERLMKEKFLDSNISGANGIGLVEPGEKVKLPDEKVPEVGGIGFWEHDEGVDEIKRLVKEA